MTRIKNKKSQHETLGFVLIVMIVVIIIVIFLGLSAGKGNGGRQNSVEISNLLQSSIYYTTDCAINFPVDYENVQGLISACYQNPDQNCLDGKKVCEVLNETFKKIVSKSLRIDAESPNNAYTVNIYFSPINNLHDKTPITFIWEGEFVKCKSKPGGIYLLPTTTFSSITIGIELEICSG
jgi:hypothetical protein